MCFHKLPACRVFISSGPESHSFTITITGDLSNIQNVYDNYCAVLNENVPHKLLGQAQFHSLPAPC